MEQIILETVAAQYYNAVITFQRKPFTVSTSVNQ